MRDRHHPGLGLFVVIAALACAFMLPAAASAAATGSITYSAATTNAATVSIAYTSSGTSSRQVERHEAPLVGNACGAYGAWAAVSSVDPASPWVDATTAHGTCYQWRVRLTDTATTPVTTYATSVNVVKVDRVSPAASIDATPPSPLVGSKTMTGTLAEPTTAAATVAVRYVGAASATICASATKTTTTWTCTWATGTVVASGTYTLEVTVTDSAGNATVVTRTVLVDNHGPVTSVAGFTELTGSPYQHAIGGTVYFNPGYAGSFSLDVSAVDADSGMDRVVFPTIATGWTPAGGTDNTAPSPYSQTYTWAAGAMTGGVKSAIAYDLAGKTTTTSFAVTSDTTAPISGTISWAPSGTNGAITFGRGSDAGAGIGPAQLQRREAPDTGSCGAWGAWADLGAPVTVSPYLDTTVLTGRCYEYRLRNYDNVGNVVNVLGSGQLRNVGVSDTTLPSGTITASPVDPVRGAITLSGSSADSESGVASVSVDVSGAGNAHVCTVTGVGAAAWSCPWDTTGTPDGVYTITATVTDIAGNVALPITRMLVIDNGGPTLSFDSFMEGVNAGWQHAIGSTIYVNPAQSGSFEVRIAASDVATGVAQVMFPSVGTGWLGGGVDNVGPSPYSSSYTWTAGAGGAGTHTVTGQDQAGNTATASFTVASDSLPPTGGSATVTWNTSSDRAVVTHASGSDAGAGIGSTQLQRRSATYVASTCGSFGSWANVGPTSPASPWTDTTAAHGTCYEYRLEQVDQVGNASYVATGQVFAPPVAGVVASSTSLSIAEAGATDSFTLSLTRQPTSTVTITLTPNSQVWVSPSTFSFTPTSWNIPQTFTVTAIDDIIEEADPHAGLVTLTSASADPAFAGLAIPTIVADIADDDTAEVATYVPMSSSSVAEGGGVTLGSIWLTTEPSADVTVVIDGGSQLSVSPATLTFSAMDWNVPQQFLVTAVDDAVVESTHAGSVDFSVVSADPYYDGFSLAPTTISITDNDTTPAPVPSGDVTPPSGGAVSMADSWTSSALVQVPFVVGTDAGSGIGSWRLQRRLGTLAGSTCSSWGAWVDRGSANGASPYSDITTNGTCAQYRLVVVDVAGNDASFTASGVARIDRVTPYGAIDAVAGGTARGTTTIEGMAVDAVSDVRVSVAFTGPATGDLCFYPPVNSGRWACAWDTTNIPNGSYLLTATIVDSAGNTNTETLNVSVANTVLAGTAPPPTPGATAPTAPTTRDEEPPVVTRPAMPAIAWGPKALLRWVATDDSGSRPSSVIEQRTATAKGGWSAWVELPGLTADTLSIKLPPRVATSCYRVVATDPAGNRTTSTESCANVPIDDRSLTRSGSWKRSKARGAHGSTLSTASRGSASLSLPIGAAQEIQLIAATGPRSGKVRVMSGKELLGTVSLRSARAKQRVVLRVPKAPRAGVLRIVVVPGSGPVQLDGVIVAR